MQNSRRGTAALARHIQLAPMAERVCFRDDGHAMLTHAAAQQEVGLYRQVTVPTERRSVSLILKNSSGQNGAPDASAVIKQEEFHFTQPAERRHDSVRMKPVVTFI